MIWLFLSLFAVFYIYSSTKVFSTGDGAELLTSAITLGIAHPSGYPLYMEILRLFSLIPIGSIPFRAVLVSILFALLSLYILYKIVLKITDDKYSALFGVALLGVAYSFFGQSVVIKFYTLNLFIISIMLYIGVKTALEGYKKEYQYFSAFLLGLTLSNHHTGFMMVLPFIILSLFYIKDVIRNLPVSIGLFILGFLANLHMLLRGNKVFSQVPVEDLSSFLEVFLRKPYEKGSSINVVKTGFFDFSGYFYATKNISIILYNNFTPIAFLFFFIGLFFVFKISKKVWIFLLTFFFTYSIFLAKMTFSQTLIDMNSWYIVAHQYFLPMLFSFAIFSSIGVAYFVKILPTTEFLKKFIPVSISVGALLPIFERLIDQNFNNNYVPYSIPKTIIGSLPIGSVYLTHGDNHNFSSWYMKYVALYRQDICSQDYVSPEKNTFLPRGCYPLKFYKNSYIFSEFFKGDFSRIAANNRLYSVIYLTEPNPLAKFFDNYFWIFSFSLVPKNIKISEEIWDKKVSKWVEPAEISIMDCSFYQTDDRFSAFICGYSLPMFAYLIKSVGNKQQGIDLLINDNNFDVNKLYQPSKNEIKYAVRYMGNTFRIYINTDDDKKYPGASFIIKLTDENRNLIELYNNVMKNNTPEKFIYYQYSSEYRGKK